MEALLRILEEDLEAEAGVARKTFLALMNFLGTNTPLGSQCYRSISALMH
jgi:thioredoxin-like negative regulator of GroEL